MESQSSSSNATDKKYFISKCMFKFHISILQSKTMNFNKK